MKLKTLLILLFMTLPTTTWAENCRGNCDGTPSIQPVISNETNITDFGESIETTSTATSKSGAVGVGKVDVDVDAGLQLEDGAITINGGSPSSTIEDVTSQSSSEGGEGGSVGDISISNNHESSKIPVNSAFAPAVMTACASSAAGTNKSFSVSFGKNDPICYLAVELDHRYRQHGNCVAGITSMQDVLNDVVHDKSILAKRISSSTGDMQKAAFMAHKHTVNYANALNTNISRKSQTCQAHANRITYLEHQYAVQVDSKIGRNTFLKWIRAATTDEIALMVDGVLDAISGNRL